MFTFSCHNHSAHLYILPFGEKFPFVCIYEPIITNRNVIIISIMKTTYFYVNISVYIFIPLVHTFTYCHLKTFACKHSLVCLAIYIYYHLLNAK